MTEADGSVVAIIDDHQSALDALGRLAADGFGADLLHGEEGRTRLDDAEQTGFASFLRRLAHALGDEVRIRDRLDRALSTGASVVSVDVEADHADEVSRILEAHGGHDMWRLGEWTQNRVGERGSGEG
jgi:hypothetical protein